MKAAAILLALCLTLPWLRAEEAKAPAAPKAPAEALFDLLNVEDVSMAAARLTFKASLDQIKSLGVSEEGLQEIEGAADRMFRKCFGGPDFRRAVIELYEKNFTPEEMKALLEFYRSPVGQKCVKVMPKIMGEAGLVGQEIVQKNMADFQVEIEAIMKKYVKPKAAPKAGR